MHEPVRQSAGRSRGRGRSPRCGWLLAGVAGLVCVGVTPGAGQAQSGHDSASAQRAAAAMPDTSAARIGAPVVFQGDTLFYVPAALGPFSAAERAAAIVSRLSRLARAGGAAESITVANGETATDLIAADAVILTITDADARAAGRPRAELARAEAGALSAALARGSWTAVMRSVGVGLLWSLLVTAVLVVAIRLLGMAFPRIHAAVEAARRTRIPTIRIQKLEFVSADRVADVLVGITRGVRVAVVVLLLYFYVLLVLSFFPWTRPLAGSILGYITTPLVGAWHGFTGYLPSAFFIAVVVLITRYLLKFVHALFGAVGRGVIQLPGFHADWAEPTYKITRFLVLAFVLVVIFPYLPGASSEGFKGVSLFLGVLFSLGSSSAIGNVVAGVVLTYTRAFQLGDRVKIADTVGDVVARTLLVTRVRTIKNVDVTIPNALVLGSHIVNYSAATGGAGLVLHTSVTIGYDTPWRQVHELLIAAARATDDILATPAPFVLQTGLDDFYVRYELNAYTDQPRVMAQTYSALHQHIQDTFNEAGVEIMSPHYGSHRDGNQTTVPASYLAQDYQAPPFRVLPLGPEGMKSAPSGAGEE